MSFVARLLIGSLLLVSRLFPQTLVVDRPPGPAPQAQRIELPGKGFLGDRFRIGKTGEIWMIGEVTLWAYPATGGGCGTALGDSIEKLTLLGALDNPPVPGQPVCDCHALVALATLPLQPGSNASKNPNITLTREGLAWRIDFKEVRWSMPGGVDAVFSVRATARARNRCRADTAFSLSASPPSAGFGGESHRLTRLDPKGVPLGFADLSPAAGSIDIRVWASPSR
jgi:hypothetical protein